MTNLVTQAEREAHRSAFWAAYGSHPDDAPRDSDIDAAIEAAARARADAPDERVRAMGERINRMKGHISDAEDQRDKLAAMVREIVDRYAHDTYQDYAERIYRARALLAEIGGTASAPCSPSSECAPRDP